MVYEQVSARQQRVFPPRLLLREDLDGGALLVQPARDVDQVVQARAVRRCRLRPDLTPALIRSVIVRMRDVHIGLKEVA